MNKADFENDHLLYEAAINSQPYQVLLRKIERCKKIFLLGNGGLMDVSSHGAADLSRLVPGKVFRSFNDAGFMSSNSNDFGWENSFVIWLEKTVFDIENKRDTLIIGLSCSGNSANVIRALNVAQENQYDTFLITGAKSTKKSNRTDELSFGCNFFHTTEVLTMKLFYDIVHKLGHHCPAINEEIKRKEGYFNPGMQTV